MNLQQFMILILVEQPQMPNNALKRHWDGLETT
jgi:hypothetical protein